MQSSLASYSNHLVIPGQLIAVSREGSEETSFLRGHGTYLDTVDAEAGSSNTESYLRASVTGTVQRVNKLISVIPLTSNRYDGHVGDLIVGRIVSVVTSGSSTTTAGMRWRVQLLGSPSSPLADLPLSGVHLPGGVQRVRTLQDARQMRFFLQEGDIVSAEVHKILNGGSLQLHTRSTRYGKLSNGCWITVPPGFIPKRKNHYVTNFMNQFDILLGCNGCIWMQRRQQATPSSSTTTTTTSQQQQQQQQSVTGEEEEQGMTTAGPELVEYQEAQQKQHNLTPYSLEERQALARLRNSIECLRLAACPITVENIQYIYQQSLLLQLEKPNQLLTAWQIIHLTQNIPPTS